MAALANAFFSTQSSPLSPPLSRFFSSEIASKVHIHDALRISFHPVSGSISDRTGFRRNTKRRAPMRKIPTASSNSSNVPRPSPVSSDEDSVPTPIVLIDQDSDSEATIVHLSFGDRLGALIDTMKALKDLGLDVTKGTVNVKGSIETKFSITKSPEIFRKDWFIIERVHDASLGDQLPKAKHIVTRSLSASGRKLEDPDMLERVRLTIISNLLKYHPECSEMLAMGEAFGIKAPQKKLDVDITTYIHVEDDGPKRSMLWIECADRPGLLLEIIKIISDINITVESAEIDTEGLIAKDKFHVSYRGAALNASLSQVLTNCLRYYLRRPEADEDSY